MSTAGLSVEYGQPTLIGWFGLRTDRRISFNGCGLGVTSRA